MYPARKRFRNSSCELDDNEIWLIISLIQSGGDTKDLRNHGNPFKEGANLSE